MDYFLAIREITHWLLVVISIALIVTGLGITDSRTVQYLTGGLLDRSLSFTIHSNIWILFLVLLALHIFFTVYSKKMKKPNLKESSN
jgi:Ni,Fe-hydrogenase I cytochrome b subunit